MIFAFALLAAATTSVLLMSVATAFIPIILVDIYIETQPLADLKSKDDDARTGDDPILVRVAKHFMIPDTHSQHMVTTTRHNQTVVVIPIWAGYGAAETRRRRPSDRRLGCVRVSVPPAPRGVARIFVSTYVMFEYCGYWEGSGMPPHIHRDRLLVETWVEGDEITSKFSDAVLYAQSPAIDCFPMGRWHPSDLKDQMSSITCEDDEDDELMYNSSAVDNILLELTNEQDSKHNRAEHEVNRVVELAEHMCETTSTSNNNAGSYVRQCKSTMSSNSSRGCIKKSWTY